MSITKKCTKVNELPGYEQARLWWRSRLPEEKTAILTSKEYLFFPNIAIVVPVPLQGYITVIRTNENFREEINISLRTKQTELLRRFYLKANQKGWVVQRGKDSVVFVRPGRVVRVGRSGAERFLWP